MNTIFEIGGWAFCVEHEETLIFPENFMRFARADREPAYTYTMTAVQEFPLPQGKLLAERPDLAIFEDQGLEIRYIGLNGQCYACIRELDDTHAQIAFRQDTPGMGEVDPMFLAMFAMERRMLAQDNLILHCAYMQWGEEAILFSAPSGTGKTTQAGLWEQYRGTRVVNGDRGVLRRIDGQWYACGWPVCGSSGVCHDETRKIRAIVMLSQAKENQITRLTPFRAFTEIYSQITINTWSREAQDHAMDLLDNLCGQVPIYHLACDISEQAVSCLEQALEAQA